MVANLSVVGSVLVTKRVLDGVYDEQKAKKKLNSCSFPARSQALASAFHRNDDIDSVAAYLRNGGGYFSGDDVSKEALVAALEEALAYFSQDKVTLVHDDIFDVENPTVEKEKENEDDEG